jgi:hypothetical protein
MGSSFPRHKVTGRRHRYHNGPETWVTVTGVVLAYRRHLRCACVARADDRVWADLDDGEPPNADLTATTQDMAVSCWDHTFTEFIDHLAVDRRVLPWVDRTSFRHVTYRQADKAVWNQISDHCPVVIELWIR